MSQASERYARVSELFQAAVEFSAQDRAALLEAECGGDKSLREEIEALLEADAESDGFIEQPISAIPADLLTEEDFAGRQFGAYRVIREIGRGGLGAVYLAARADEQFQKQVAIKVVKRGLDTGDILRRFRAERQILAQLDHANIARLIDAGSTEEGLPYFVLEYVEGETISSYCETHKLSTAERLDLFRLVCSAVTYAHQHLVIHRDIKPSNILVTANGVPKLLDFGIAKVLHADDPLAALTMTGVRVMTPEYASPEQVRGLPITTTSDIYSLRVLLYELLTGQKPYRLTTHTQEELSRAVVEQTPDRPSTAIRSASFQLAENSTLKSWATALRGDLDNIVLMALRKEPERRYGSVERFSEDIRRHQEGLPVAARPNTLSYRASKFVQRHRAGVAAGAIVILAIIGGMITTLWQASVARAERTRAERRFNDVRALAGSFLFEFSPLIEKLQGSIPARELLVRRALQYLDSLSRESGGDLELQRELAAAYVKVGDVQGHPYNPNLGDIKGALESYAKAQAIRQRLWEHAPSDANAQGELADVLKLYADAQSNGGDHSKAERSYDQALELREKVVAQRPGEAKARADLAETLRARGLTSFYESDNKRAIEFFSRARDINDQLRGEQPDNWKFMQQYAHTLTLIGDAQGWDNDFVSASVNLQKGIDLLRALAEKHPREHSIQHTLMLALKKRGENHGDLKELNEAVAMHSQSVEIAQKLLAADPQSFQAKRDVAMITKRLAQALDAAGRSRESLEKLAVVLSTFQEMSAADSNNTEYPYDIANTRFAIGEAHVTLQEHEAALRCFLQARDEFAAVLARNPENTYAARMSSYNFDRLAKSYAALAEKGNREEYLGQAVTNWRAALEGFNGLKANGNLGELDSNIIAETEKEIEKIAVQLKEN